MTGVISRIDIHQIHLSHDVWLGGRVGSTTLEELTENLNKTNKKVEEGATNHNSCWLV